MAENDADLVLHDGHRLFPGEQKLSRCAQAGGNPAHAVLATDQHGLRGLVSRAELGTEVIGGRQPEPLAIPKDRVVPRMVVGVPTQNVEGEPGK